VSNGSRAPQRKVYDGQEFFSVRAAAAVLNRTPRTLRRLEHELPNSRPGMRWYSQQDLAELQRLVTESGFAEDQRGGRGRLKGLLEGLATGPRSSDGGKQASTWAGEHVSRRPRELLHRDDADDGGEWAPPGERSSRPEAQALEPVPPPIQCPRCETELFFVMQPVPGAGQQRVAMCERHSAIDLQDPAPPDPGACTGCRAPLVWQLGDYEGFQPFCPLHGPVQAPNPVRRQDIREVPWRHEVEFGIGAVATGRTRGLQQGDAVAAIRMGRPQAGPKLLIVDPQEGPTRPR
jgi:hypothetical protein